MKRILILLFLTLLSCTGYANVVLKGHVISLLTREGIADAEVRVEGANASVITNEDGYFTLKLDELPTRLLVSALGYVNSALDCGKVQDLQNINVWLQADSYVLNNVMVYSAEDIVMKALEKVEQNFSLQTERLSCFYRETVRKQNRYVSLSEAVMDIYKTGYDHDINRDKVLIVKGRSLISQRAKDTLSVRVMGGPHEAVLIDLVKNREILFYEDDLTAYRYEMEGQKQINGRLQFVINFHPVEVREYPLYSGTIYIDVERLSFTRIESSMDVSDQGKAVRSMLIKKPRGLRFKPKALNTTVNYHYDGQCSRISYIRNVYLFNCDWKRRLFSTGYRAVSEMVVTDNEPTEMVRGWKNTFGRYDVLSSEIADFEDEEFWNDYNIIEPSESLEHAVKRLKKRAAVQE